MNRTSDPLSGIGPVEIEFLVRLGNELASRRSEVSSFDKFRVSGQVQWIAGRDRLTDKKSDVAKRSYLDYLRWYVNLRLCLDLRNKYSGSRNRRIPRADIVSRDILVENGLWGVSDDDVTKARANALRESLAATLGLLKKRSIKGLRDEIIVECYGQGKSQSEIAAELDAHEDLLRDPLLEKWRAEVFLETLTWRRALKHTRLAAKVTTLFSKTWERAKNRT